MVQQVRESGPSQTAAEQMTPRRRHETQQQRADEQAHADDPDRRLLDTSDDGDVHHCVNHDEQVREVRTGQERRHGQRREQRTGAGDEPSLREARTWAPDGMSPCTRTPAAEMAQTAPDVTRSPISPDGAAARRSMNIRCHSSSIRRFQS